MPPILRSIEPVEIDSLTAALEENRIFWVDIDSSDPEQHRLLSDIFNFHPLTIEYVDDPDSRIKIENFKEYLFLTVRAVTNSPNNETLSFDLETKNLHIYLSRKYVVSVHDGPNSCIDNVEKVIDRNPEILASGPAHVAHVIMDSAVDGYFPVLDEVDDFVDDMEAVVFGKFRESAIHEIFKVKRLVMSLRRHLSPQRDLFSALSTASPEILPQESQIYFRDIYDHVLHMIEHLDAIREVLTGAMESYLSQVSNRLGNVTKGLSVIATLSIPFVIVSGMWGMNFTNIPFTHSPLGFWIILVVQIVIGLVLLAILRWKNLL